MINHHIQHGIAPVGGIIEIFIRIIGIRPVDNPCQQRAFTQAQIFCVLAKIILRRFLHAADIAAEVQFVQIQLKDLLLINLFFQLQRCPDFLDLTINGLFRNRGVFQIIHLEVGVFYKLHRKGGTALTEALGF